MTVLEFVADPEAVMTELARVVRPAGRIVIGARFAAGELPVLRVLGAICEFAGPAVPFVGAFQVLIVDRT